MNKIDIRKGIHSTTVTALRERSYATKEGKLAVLVQTLKNMGHNHDKIHDKYPQLNPEKKERNGLQSVKISFADNLIDCIENHVTAVKMKKMAVITSIDPFVIGGKSVNTSNTAEAFLFRHTTLGSAQHRSGYRTNFYDRNSTMKFKAKLWNDLVGSKQVSYVYNVNLLARAEQRIVESDLPQTSANENRLIKELYHNFDKTFNVVMFDMPHIPRQFEYNSLSANAKETLNQTVYQKLYKSFELMQKNHVKVAILTDLINDTRIPVSVILNALQKVINDFVIFKGYKQTLQEIIIVDSKLQKELEQKPLTF